MKALNHYCICVFPTHSHSLNVKRKMDWILTAIRVQSENKQGMRNVVKQQEERSSFTESHWAFHKDEGDDLSHDDLAMCREQYVSNQINSQVHRSLGKQP